MARSDRNQLVKTVFGEQFSSLPAKLNDSDPRERIRSLSLLETYLDDCLKPILELRRQIAAAVYEAERQSRNPKDRSPKSIAAPETQESAGRRKLPSQAEQIAIIEALVGDA